MTKTSTRLILAAAIAGLSASAFAADGGRPLSAHLTGAAEKPASGDPDGGGHATLRVNIGQSQICYDLMVENISTATMAHIHKAGPDAAGPVVVPLTAPDAGGKSSACATADAALVKDILQNPGAYYVNIHNADFRAGAVRGQLTK